MALPPCEQRYEIGLVVVAVDTELGPFLFVAIFLIIKTSLRDVKQAGCDTPVADPHVMLRATAASRVALVHVCRP